MPNLIANDLSKFTNALENGMRVDCNRKGEWYQEGVFRRIVRWLFGCRDSRVVNVASAFNKVLDDLEKIPVKFNAGVEVTKSQKENFTLHLQAAESVKKQLEKFKTTQTKQKLGELNLRIVALKYRIEEANGGVSPSGSVDQMLYQDLEKLAQGWKDSYSLYTDKKLCLKEKEKLGETCLYPEFVELLKLDKGLRGLFFKWALRDNCDVRAFVQFPSTSAKLKAAFLAGRIGRFADHIPLMKFRNLETGSFANAPSTAMNAGWEKDYVLPFEVQEEEKLKVKEYSILDENQVINTDKNYKRTVKQIIASFANRNSEAGNFEMLGTRILDTGETLGPRIANHNSLELGPYNPETGDFERPNLSKSEKMWWKQISPLDTIDLEQVKKMYGIEDIEEGQWVAAVRSSREDNGLDVDRSHGFIDVLIPDGNGKYELFAFGKYAARWPSSILEKAFFITNTLPSKIECPDENHFMGQRQQAISPKVIEHEDGLELMEYIRKDLVKAQQGNIVFQFPWENCAWWCQKLLEKLLGPQKYGGPIPNYYRSPLLEAQPKIQPLPIVFKICRALKGKAQSIAVKIVEFLLLSWRGTTVVENGKKVFKAVTNSSHMKRLEIYHPSVLHERIMKGEIKGVVTMGQLFLPQMTALSH